MFGQRTLNPAKGPRPTARPANPRQASARRRSTATRGPMGSARTSAPLLPIALAGAAGIWAGGLVAVPMVPAPITLQTLALVLCGGLFGVRAGALAGAAFLAAVLAGAPILSGGASAGGAAFLELKTAGFVLAFVPAGALAGLAVGRWRQDAALFLLAHLVVVVAGFTWLALRTGLSVSDGAASIAALVPGALVKSAVGAAAVRALGQRRGPDA